MGMMVVPEPASGLKRSEFRHGSASCHQPIPPNLCVVLHPLPNTSSAPPMSSRRSESPEISTHLTPSPAKRTRSSISRGLNSVSPVQQTKTGADSAAISSVPGPKFDTLDPTSTSSSGAGAGAATGNGTGRRVRTRNKPNPALVNLNANGNNGTTGDKSAGKGESEKDGSWSKDKGYGAFVMDLSEDEDEGEGHQEMQVEMDGGSGLGRILGRKKRGEILGVLVA
jgi:hypothetical protein